MFYLELKGLNCSKILCFETGYYNLFYNSQIKELKEAWVEASANENENENLSVFLETPLTNSNLSGFMCFFVTYADLKVNTRL